MKIENGSVYTKDGTFKNISICTTDDLIAEKSSDNLQIDATNMYVVPGFIDLHFHGACSCDFMDNSPSALEQIALFEASVGVTSICPASMTMSVEQIKNSIVNATKFKPQDQQSSLVGIYLEGPFVSPHKLGAQNGEYVLKPNKAVLDELIQLSNGLVKVVTVAPEMDGALDLISAFKNKVVFSLAHTCATYEQAFKAYMQGAKQLTHTFNAMNPIHHRAPGPICAAFQFDDVNAELICDGVHIHEGAVKMVFKLFSNVVLISDSMEATGLQDGTYQLGGQDVFVTGNRAVLKDGTIAGSVTNLYDCFVTAVKKFNIPLERVIESCTKNPAKVLQIYDKVGSLDPGKQADILLIDKSSLELKHVILRGKTLF